MAVFKDVITTEGEVLIAKMLSGQCEIVFTRMEWGDGALATGEDARNIKELKHKITASSTMTVARDNQMVYVSADFTNQELSEGMYLREKGIYASDGTSEILMIYANNGSLAEYIAPAIEGLIEKTMRSIMTFNQGDNISVQLKSETFIYKDDFEKHLNDDDNPHQIKYELPEELTELQSKEHMSTAFGKIAKAVKELIAHFKDKVIHITDDERNKWDKATQTSVSRNLTTGTKVGTITVDGKEYDLYCQTNTDTKNTAGSTNSNNKLFLIGAASQSANPQTYSHDTAYVGADGCLYSNNSKTVTVSDITQSSAVTSTGQKTLDAIEKNASVKGTLANQIASVNGSLTGFMGTIYSNGSSDFYERMKYLIDSKKLPTGKPFAVVEASYGRTFLTGQLYPEYNYGEFFAISHNFDNNAFLFTLDHQIFRMYGLGVTLQQSTD